MLFVFSNAWVTLQLHSFFHNIMLAIDLKEIFLPTYPKGNGLFFTEEIGTFICKEWKIVSSSTHDKNCLSFHSFCWAETTCEKTKMSMTHGR